MSKALIFYEDYFKCSCCEEKETEIVFCVDCYNDILKAKEKETAKDIIMLLKSYIMTSESVAAIDIAVIDHLKKKYDCM